MKHGAIFDMDGTLVDTERFFWNAWIETADKFGVERNEKLPASMSGSLRPKMPEIIRRFYPNVDAEKYIDIVYAQVEIEREKNIPIKPGAVEILEYFREQKVPIAVASSSEIATVEKNLTRIGIRKYFDVIIGGDQIKNGKPAPDIFLKAAEKIQVAPEDCYIFEDSFNGIRAAAAAKSSAVMVIDCVQPTDEIRELCSGVFNSLNEALAAIRSGKI